MKCFLQGLTMRTAGTTALAVSVPVQPEPCRLRAQSRTPSSECVYTPL